MIQLRKYLLVLLFVLACVAQSMAAPMRPARAQKAMVVSIHEAASLAGVQMMREGGNAVDAAVATAFALAVVHPQAGNIGGGGFLLLRTADGKTTFIDFREKAPSKATANMYLDEKGNVIEELSTIGYKAVAVPGSVAGLSYAQKKYGKLPLARVMQPAIRLAREGFPLAYEDTQAFKDPKLAQFADSYRIFQRNGNYYKPGDLFRQPELARTLTRIAANPEDFYNGALARELASAVTKGGGLITAEDLAAYKVEERAPVRGSYRGLEIISAPPPSSGGVALIESLNIVEGFDLRTLGNRSAQGMHLTMEAFRRAFYDRADFMGDPDFTPIPVAQLIDKRYGERWRESLHPQKATPSKELERQAFENLDRSARLEWPRELREPEHTTHFSVVDPDGNAVSLTTTLNDSFGSRVTATGLGFLLNDEMDDFASKQGVPNAYGLIQGPANAIGPGKRPLSAMTPTIVLKDGKLFLILGSPGGPTIITTVANVLMGVVDHGMNIQEAVNAPRFHHQWLPDETRIERVGFSPDTITMLEQMGHKFDRRSYWGDAECIMIDEKTNERLGGSDGRNNGKAIGF